MKTALIFLLFGALTVFAIVYFNQRTAEPSVSATASTFAAKAHAAADDLTVKTRETADRVKDSVNEKLEDWHLTPAEIKSDLAQTGEVVRRKAHATGVVIADARIVTVIKAKYVLDRDLSAPEITVGADGGEVVLSGSLPSVELVGRAIQLALDTDGVRAVHSKLRLATPAPH